MYHWAFIHSFIHSSALQMSMITWPQLYDNLLNNMTVRRDSGVRSNWFLIYGTWIVCGNKSVWHIPVAFNVFLAKQNLHYRVPERLFQFSTLCSHAQAHFMYTHTFALATFRNDTVDISRFTNCTRILCKKGPLFIHILFCYHSTLVFEHGM